jgi:PAS domain S-box-containing protein
LRSAVYSSRTWAERSCFEVHLTAFRRLAPLLLEDTDPQRLAFIVRRVCVANALALAIWSPVAAFVLERPRNALLGGVAAIGLLALAALAKRRPVGAGAGVAAWIWTMGLLSQLGAGGIPATTTGTYLLAVVAAGLLLGVIPAVLTSALTVLVSGAVAYAGDQGLIDSLFPTPSRMSLWWFSLTSVVAMPVLMAETLTRVRGTLRQVEEAERRYRLVSENSRDLIWLIEDGVLRYVSPACERLLGWTPEEQLARGSDVRNLTPDSALIVGAALARAVANRDPFLRYEAEHVRRDGSTVVCEVEMSLLYEPAGGLRAVLGMTRDITSRRRIEQERERLAAELVQAQKMEVVGRVAAGVAHDLNNQLTVILSGIDVMSDALPARRNEAQKDMETAAQNAIALTRQLQLFNRKGTLAAAPVDLNAMVHRLERTLRRVIGADVEIAVALPSAPAIVLVDAAQIEQAVLNLALNARDAMPGGGRLGIEVSAADGASDVWQLSVSDTGTGIDEAARPRLFEPFFTTKPPGRGTGLGLSMVRRVVEESGGRVSFESALGRGTTFRIELPRHAGPPVEGIAADADVSEVTRAATVLVVDDSPEVRRLLARAIGEDGHRVIDAGTAAQAIALLDREPLDLLVTDVVMPGMRGPELAAQLRRDLPGLHVLYVTGYVSEELDLSRDPRSSVLWKPFSMKQLRREVRRVIEAALVEKPREAPRS